MLFVTNLLLNYVDLDIHFRTSKFQEKWTILRIPCEFQDISGQFIKFQKFQEIQDCVRPVTL